MSAGEGSTKEHCGGWAGGAPRPTRDKGLYTLIDKTIRRQQPPDGRIITNMPKETPVDLARP